MVVGMVGGWGRSIKFKFLNVLQYSVKLPFFLDMNICYKINFYHKFMFIFTSEKKTLHGPLLEGHLV